MSDPAPTPAPSGAQLGLFDTVQCAVGEGWERFDLRVGGTTYLGAGILGVPRGSVYRSVRHLERALLRRCVHVHVIVHSDRDGERTVPARAASVVILSSTLPPVSP